MIAGNTVDSATDNVAYVSMSRLNDSISRTGLSSKQSEFFLPPNLTYLNCAFMAPMSRAVEEAGIYGIRLKRDPSEIRPRDFFDDSDAVREEFARLIGAPDPANISIAPSVSYAIATAARNISIAPGDEVIILSEQFPSHVYSWRRLIAESGGRLVVIDPPKSNTKRGERWNERILESINKRTVAVCIPVVHWADGTLFDTEIIAARARDVGAFLIIDGTQSIGALPIDVTRIQPDALVCAGYKWLLGPYGVAISYWSERLLNGIPIEENWITRRGSENFAGLVDYEDAYQGGAVRFDVGQRSNFVTISMLLEALKMINRWAPLRIQDYCRNITREALDEIGKMGYEIECEKMRCHHLIGVRAPSGFTLNGLHDQLSTRKISVSLRGSAIRVSPNVYNDKNDLAALVDTLRAFSPEKA